MSSFDWDNEKDLSNQEKHGISFSEAQFAFADPDESLQKMLHIVMLKIGSIVLVPLVKG